MSEADRVLPDGIQHRPTAEEDKSIPLSDLTPNSENNGSTDTKESEGKPHKPLKEYFRIEPDLIIYKLFYFSFGSAIGAIAPLMVLFYKQLGFGPDQIGLISGLRPLVGFLSAPFIGACASRFKISKIILIVSLVGWLGFFLGIGMVTPPRITNEHCQALKYYSGPNSSVYNAAFESKISVRPKPGVSYEESLIEDRAWMFKDEDLMHVFLIIISLVIVGEVVQSPVSALSDAACLEKLGHDNLSKYGSQRLWGSIGFGIV